MDREIFRSNEYRRNMFQHAKCFIKKKCVFEKSKLLKKKGFSVIAGQFLPRLSFTTNKMQDHCGDISSSTKPFSLCQLV